MIGNGLAASSSGGKWLLRQWRSHRGFKCDLGELFPVCHVAASHSEYRLGVFLGKAIATAAGGISRPAQSTLLSRGAREDL